MRALRGDEGAATVEFALVAPIFLMLVFGIISFGIVFAQDLALENGARQAARAGVVEASTCGQIKDDARAAATSIAMSSADVVVTVKRGLSPAAATDACAAGDAVKPCQGSSAGDSIFVRLDYTSKLIVPLAVVKSSFPISGEGIFRCEFS